MRPGVLEIVGSNFDGVDPFVGTSIRDVFPVERWGRQHVKLVNSEMVTVDHLELERMKELGPYSTNHTVFTNVKVLEDVVERYAGKVVLITATQKSGMNFAIEFWCKQFPKSIVVLNEDAWALVNFVVGVPDRMLGTNCTVLMHNHEPSVGPSRASEQLVTHLQRSNATVYVNLETAENPYKVVLSSPWTPVFFTWVPALISLFLLQLAIRVLIKRWRQGWQTKTWHITLTLVCNVITLFVISLFFLIDGYTTQSRFDFPLQNYSRQLFSFVRCGSNLAIAIVWSEIMRQAYRTSDTGWRDRFLKTSVPLLFLLEIPVLYFLLNPATSYAFAKIVPALALPVELSVGLYFAISAFRLLKKLALINGQSTMEGKASIERVSKLVFLSGFNSLLNIAVLAYLALNTDFVLSAPIVYLTCSGFIAYCRLIDATLQILVIKGSSAPLIPAFLTMVKEDSKAAIVKTFQRVLTQKKSQQDSGPPSNYKKKSGGVVVPTMDSSRWQTALD